MERYRIFMRVKGTICNAISKNNNIQQIPTEQQNIEEKNTNNDTFIDKNPSSLASLRGKPPTEKISITIIHKTQLSHALYSHLY
jgi:hypothetical protein